MTGLDLFNNLTKVSLDTPRSVTAGANRTGVDVRSYIGVGIALLTGLNVSGTSPTLDVKLQESATLGGTYTDVTSGAFTQMTDSVSGNQVISVNLDSCLGFLRVVDASTGTNPVFVRAVTLFARPQVL